MDQKVGKHQSIIFLVLFCGYGSYVLNRKSVSSILPELVSEFLDNSDAGIIISSQYVAYSISQFIGGILSDRFSPKILFIFGLFFSGLTTILFALSSESVGVLSLLWFVNGFSQGFGWPSLAKLIRNWFTKQQLGTFWSLLSSSSNLSGGLSPLLASCINARFGWRTTLLVFGLVSIVMSLVAFSLLTCHPNDVGLQIINRDVKKKDHPSVNDPKTKNQNQIKLIDLLKSPVTWTLSFCYMVVYATKTCAYDWGKLYLMHEKNLDSLMAAMFTSTVELGGLFGTISAGYLTDRIVSKRVDSRSLDRLPLAIFLMMMATFSLHLLCSHVDLASSHSSITLIAFMLGISLYGPYAIFGVMACESVPDNLSGTSYAIVSLTGNVGAIISGYPFSLLAKHYGWHCVFTLLECLTMMALLVLIFFYCKNSQKIKIPLVSSSDRFKKD